jgi:glycosyltransferase involved in cell wall biosynthesis
LSLSKAPGVLYIAYWGAAEPLGQSLVVPAVKQLAARGIRLTLVTFEKPADFANRKLMRSVRNDLEAAGVRWIPLRYHKTPRIPATAWDVIHGWSRALLAALPSAPDIVHGRTFVGGFIGMIVAQTLRSRFVYHAEGFYAEEQADGGFWTRDSRTHRVVTAVDRAMYGRAHGLVVLSSRARAVVEQRVEVRRRGTPVVVVPSCVDLKRFEFVCPKDAQPIDPIRFVYAGSIGGRYDFQQAGRFVAAANRLREARLHVLTRSDPALVATLLAQQQLSSRLWSCEAATPDEMPARLRQHHVGLIFLKEGPSTVGGSPTKVGEYWACGLPIVTTRAVSDLDDIVSRDRVGVVLRGHTDEDHQHAFRELLALLNDRELPQRCRRAAESHYALAPSMERLRALYDALLEKDEGRCRT